MSTTLSLKRQTILKISLVAAAIIFIANIVASAYVGFKLVRPANPNNTKASPQQSNLQQAIDIISQQTLEN